MNDHKIKIQVNNMQGKPLASIQQQPSDDSLFKDNVVYAAEPTAPPEPITEPIKENITGGTMNMNASAGEVMQTAPNISLKFGVIGVGQGGSRIAATFYKRGYPTCVINTATQDLDSILVPEGNKLHIEYTLGGVGKDINLGQDAVEAFIPEIKTFLNNTFAEEDVNTFVLCVTGGGGTGSGSTAPMVRILNELFNSPVCVVYTLPMNSEGPVSKSNALLTLQKLAKLSIEKKVSTLIVADNARIEENYPGISYGKLWDVANESIVESLDMFNRLSSQKSEFESLDPTDFSKIFLAGNCTIYGRAQVNNVEHDTALADALISSAKEGLLAEGFDLTSAEQVGVIITGSKEVINKMPADVVSYAFHKLDKELGGTTGIFKGIYAVDTNQTNLQIYTMYSGLGLPKERVDRLIKEAKDKINEMQRRSADTSKMQLGFEPETAAKKQDDKFRRIEQGQSAFGRMITGKRKGFRSRNTKE